MPGSWDIKKQRDERILLGILVPPDAVASFDIAMHMRNMVLPPGSDVIKVVGLPYGPARNQAAKHALDNGYNLAFQDADVRIVDPESYVKLMATKLPLVSGLYYQRFHPYIPVLFNEGRNEKGEHTKVPVGGWKPGDIVPATFVPGGLLLVRRPALEQIFGRYPLPFSWGVDLTPVPDFEGGQVPPFSEDFVFSWRAKGLGIQPMVHTGVCGLHEVRAVVGPKWIIPMPSNDPLLGVIGVV